MKNEDREVAIAPVEGGEDSDDDDVFLLVGFSRMMGLHPVLGYRSHRSSRDRPKSTLIGHPAYSRKKFNITQRPLQFP
jgi:hypothetical protein